MAGKFDRYREKRLGKLISPDTDIYYSKGHEENFYYVEITFKPAIRIHIESELNIFSPDVKNEKYGFALIVQAYDDVVMELLTTKVIMTKSISRSKFQADIELDITAPVVIVQVINGKGVCLDELCYVNGSQIHDARFIGSLREY